MAEELPRLQTGGVLLAHFEQSARMRPPPIAHSAERNDEVLRVEASCGHPRGQGVLHRERLGRKHGGQIRATRHPGTLTPPRALVSGCDVSVEGARDRRSWGGASRQASSRLRCPSWAGAAHSKSGPTGTSMIWVRRTRAAAHAARLVAEAVGDEVDE